MKKDKTNQHVLVTVILIIISFGLAISAVFSWILSKPFVFKLLFAGLLFASALVYLIVSIFRETKPAMMQNATTVPLTSKPHFSFPPIVDDSYYLKYGYMDSFPIFQDAADIAAASEGKEIHLEEKEGFVFAIVSGKIIGHITDGRIKDMILDYKKKKYPFRACLIEFQREKTAAIYRIRFYIPLERAQSQIFSLVNLRRHTEDGDLPCNNLALCSVGDDVDIELDDDTGKYRVYSGFGCEIGTLPPSFEAFYSDISNDTYARITDIEEGDEGAKKGSIEIFILDKNKEISFIK